ncbi:CU044_2847 family protein [Almyronema epifaneia]|uniref:CU044_2847 family protein n=1 Tax=Almyronema epifaneia S1 TaxID=2991925 RepID=A0ABW6ILD8_9CYAN
MNSFITAIGFCKSGDRCSGCSRLTAIFDSNDSNFAGFWYWLALVAIIGLRVLSRWKHVRVFTVCLSAMKNDRVLAEFLLEDGTAVWVEVPQPLDEDAVEEVSVLDETLYKTEKTIESALGKIPSIASAVMSSLKAGLTTPADEVEVKFGLDLSVESGVILSTVGGSVNFEVTLKWQGK